MLTRTMAAKNGGSTIYTAVKVEPRMRSAAVFAIIQRSAQGTCIEQLLYSGHSLSVSKEHKNKKLNAAELVPALNGSGVVQSYTPALWMVQRKFVGVLINSQSFRHW